MSLTLETLLRARDILNTAEPAEPLTVMVHGRSRRPQGKNRRIRRKWLKEAITEMRKRRRPDRPGFFAGFKIQQS